MMSLGQAGRVNQDEEGREISAAGVRATIPKCLRGRGPTAGAYQRPSNFW